MTDSIFGLQQLNPRVQMDIFVLACEQRAARQPSQLCWSSLLATAITGPRRFLKPRGNSCPPCGPCWSPCPERQCSCDLCSAGRRPHGKEAASLGRPRSLGSSRSEEVRGPSWKDRRHQAGTGKRQEGNALERPARACQRGGPALHRRPALCLRGRAVLPPGPGPRPGSAAPADARLRDGDSAPLRARGAGGSPSLGLHRQSAGLPREEGPARGGGQAVAVATEEPAACAAKGGCGDPAPSPLRLPAVAHFRVSVTAPGLRATWE